MAGEHAKLPPGPSEASVVQGFKFGRDPFGYLAENGKKFGGAFTMRFPMDAPRVVVSDPSHVRQVFALKPDAYSAELTNVPVNLGEASLLFLDGERHRRDRQLLMPALHGERLRGYARTMFDVTNDFVDGWKPGDVIDMKRLLHDVTFVILLKCLFGASEQRDVDRLKTSLGSWIDRVMTPEAFMIGLAFGPRRVRAFLEGTVRRGGKSRIQWLERMPWNQAAAAKADAIQLLRDEIRKCRATGSNGRSDVLAIVANAKYEDGSPIDEEHAIDELVTMLVGGHETTANSLAWAICHIVPRADVTKKIRDEIAATFGAGPLEPARAGELKYLDACISETMRRTPIAPAVSRTMAKPFSVGPWLIPTGGIVFPSTYLTHHREDLWGDPFAFRPERFLQKDGAPPDQFFPFGGGRRTCIGMAFAYFEMRILLMVMLQRAKLRRESESLAGEFRAMTAVPKDCTVVVEEVRAR